MKPLVLVILLALILVGVSATPFITVPADSFEIPRVCAWAMYNPTYAAQCLAAMLFELWNPLDWN